MDRSFLVLCGFGNITFPVSTHHLFDRDFARRQVRSELARGPIRPNSSPAFRKEASGSACRSL
jgi:hypothetical protein